MSKEALKNIIDLVPDEDIETIYKVVIKFIPEDKPEPDELEAIAEARADHDDLISHNDINWDWWIRRLKIQPSFIFITSPDRKSNKANIILFLNLHKHVVTKWQPTVTLWQKCDARERYRVRDRLYFIF